MVRHTTSTGASIRISRSITRLGISICSYRLSATNSCTSRDGMQPMVAGVQQRPAGLAGEELFQERLRVAERVRGLLAGPVGPGFLQDLGGEEDGVAVVVPHNVVSLQHGDQQRGAG